MIILYTIHHPIFCHAGIAGLEGCFQFLPFSFPLFSRLGKTLALTCRCGCRCKTQPKTKEEYSLNDENHLIVIHIDPPPKIQLVDSAFGVVVVLNVWLEHVLIQHAKLHERETETYQRVTDFVT